MPLVHLVTKIAGSQCVVPSNPKDKDKQCTVNPLAASGSGQKCKASMRLPRNDKAKKDWVAGAANYILKDLDALLEILEEHLPLGGNGWNLAEDKFN